MYTYSPSFLDFLPFSSPQSTEQSSLCHTAGSHELSILYAVVAAAAAAKSLQSCLTLCDPMDFSPPDSPVPGILQARTPEWGAIRFSNSSVYLCQPQSPSSSHPHLPSLVSIYSGHRAGLPPGSYVEATHGGGLWGLGFISLTPSSRARFSASCIFHRRIFCLSDRSSRVS